MLGRKRQEKFKDWKRLKSVVDNIFSSTDGERQRMTNYRQFDC